jgi:mono/diheme cytochrome c family protein
LRGAHEPDASATTGLTRSWWLAITAGVAVALVFVALIADGATAGRAAAADLRDPEAELGEQIYRDHCASCHGVELEGQPGGQRPLPDGGLSAPPHGVAGHTSHHPDRLLFEITKFGGQALAPPGHKSNMPAFGQTLSDEEIWAVLAYIKSRWPEEIRARQAEITRANP